MHRPILFPLVIILTLCSTATAEPPVAMCRVFEAAAPGVAADASAEPPRWGERLTYRSFDGYDYVVTAFPGVHVEVLLRDSWTLGPEALSEEEIRRLVARADLLYVTYRDLTQSEPEGEGRLRIAMVPIDGAAGYGWGGAKGVEINEATLPDYRKSYTFDASGVLLSHEMAHNFDRTSNSYAIGADRRHAWTALVQHLALVYEQGVSRHPTEVLADAIDALEYPQEWLADPRYSFDVCGALDNDCGTPRINAMFAYLGLRTLQLHGIERAPRLLDALTHWQERFGETYMPRPAADVYVEILSDTIERDASCYADAWKWYASPALRERLASKYGPNPYCADADGDGWTPLAGDPDDADPASHPMAAEVADGRDNDADGVIDNAYFAEGVDPGFGADLPVAPPVALDGRIDYAYAGDSFLFSTPVAQRFILNASRRGVFEGAVRLSRIVGTQEIPVDSFSLAQYGTTRRSWELDPGTYRMSVSGSIAGAYRIALRPAREWPIGWETIAPPVIANGQAKLMVATDRSKLTGTPTHAAFWIEGVGNVATVPWSEQVTWLWSVPAGTNRLRYRVRLMNGNAPFTAWSLPADSANATRRRSIRH